MQENKELYFGYFKHISQNIIFNDYVNLLPLNSYTDSLLCFFIILLQTINYFIPTHHESKRTLWNSFLSIPFNARIHRLQR